MDICFALSGKARGGPAKVAIISSALMGTLSGSTVSNVAITGNLTIPMMKNTGFTPKDAAAIETAASTGGAITPPIMGAGIFVMAAITGIPLVKIITYSIIPAIMYFLSIYIFVELTARKLGLEGLPPEKIPNLKKAIIKSIHLFIPLIILVYLLVIGYTPFWSSSICTIAIVFLSYLRTDTRIDISKFIKGLRKSCENMMIISSVAACAAIIMGVITITGISMKITSILIALSQGSVLLLLFLLTFLAYVLGMGMPVTLSYILVAMLGASALVKMGVPLLNSHLFLFWVSQVATISPPVCMTAFVAAEIAKERDYMGVGYRTLNVAKAIYLVPLIIIYTNIIHDDFLKPILVLIRYLPLVLAINIFTTNYFIRKLRIYDGVLIVISIIILFFAMFDQNVASNWLFTIIGSLLIFGVYFVQKNSLKTTIR
jgi:TRAP transporter 4TM/12TM fusion protein